MCNHEECLKDYEHNPKECTPEQIREYHSDIEVEQHPAEQKLEVLWNER